MTEQMKACTGCERELPLEEFHKNRAAKDGLQYRCKSCTAEYDRKRYAEHGDEIRAGVRTYKAENREKVLGAKRAYYAEHAEEEKARVRRWEQDNPERAEALAWWSSYRTRSGKYGHTPTGGQFTREDVIARWGDGCWHCPDGEFEELDHFPISVADGGSHTLDNVRPACRHSNLQGIKGAKLRRELTAERDRIIRTAEAEISSRQFWVDLGYCRAA